MADHRFIYWIRRRMPRPTKFIVLLLRKSLSRGAAGFLFGNIWYWNQVFPVINTAACSHLDLSGCLAWFVSHLTASWRLLGFVVTFDIECKVSLLLPQLQCGIMKALKETLWMERVRLVLVVKGSNSSIKWEPYWLFFSNPFDVFQFFPPLLNSY